MASWYVYLARCADDSLYCGIALDVAERVAMHNAGTGAKYTASRRPIVVVLRRRCASKSTALRLEYAIKQLTRAGKEAIVAAPRRLGPIARRLSAGSSARTTRRRPSRQPPAPLSGGGDRVERRRSAGR